CARGAVFDVW
nr:immunoglobulin heavy chain junction region [Macaca mulatta]